MPKESNMKTQRMKVIFSTLAILALVAGSSTNAKACQMLEYTKAGDGARLSMLLLHDDAEREYAYGPAQGLPDTKVGTFTQALYDEAKKDGWFVISMKNDWKRIFAFEK
jgi:hypothetical protein